MQVAHKGNPRSAHGMNTGHAVVSKRVRSSNYNVVDKEVTILGVISIYKGKILR